MKKKLVNFKVDENEYKMITVLKEKYHINISSLVRELLVKYYEQLNKKDM